MLFQSKFKALRELAGWLVAVAWLTMAAWPAEYWMEPGTIRVDDFLQGSDFEVISTSDPIRDFTGSYTVILRDATSGQVVQEYASGIFPYEHGVERPDPIYISWWAPGITPLSVGTYVMTTCWTVYETFWGIVPKKTTCSESNPFVVAYELGKNGKVKRNGKG